MEGGGSCRCSIAAAFAEQEGDESGRELQSLTATAATALFGMGGEEVLDGYGSCVLATSGAERSRPSSGDSSVRLGVAV